MKRFIKTLLIAALLTSVLAACGAEYLVHSTDKYSIEYSSDWRTFDEENSDLKDLELVLMKLGLNREVLASVSVFVEDMQVGDTDLLQYIEQDIEPFINTDGYEKIDLDKTEIAGHKTFLHHFKSLDESANEKEFLQTYVPDIEELYVLTASFPVDSETSLIAEIKRILRSFTLNASIEDLGN